MPAAKNSNKYTIVSNSQAFQDTYLSTEGSGINLHAPVSMEGSIYIVPDYDYYYPTDNDYFIYCQGNAFIDLTLNTYKNGKIFIIKAGKTFPVQIIVSTSIDAIGNVWDIGSGYTCDYHSVMIVYDKVSDNWWIMADYRPCNY